MNIATLINSKKYYSITQAHIEFEIHLEGAFTPYNTFYKKFRKWINQYNVQPVKVGRIKYYSQEQIENFINDYSFINHYATIKQDKTKI